jgi:aryl-alcohol dehydrogenase-like predicted oxidoreductase
MLARRAALSRRPRPHAAKRYTAESMQESFATSSRRLGIEHVDLFFLHEPAIDDFIDPELGAALRSLQAAGSAGSFGVSAARDTASLLLATRPDICGQAIQQPFDVLGRDAAAVPLRHPYSGLFGVLGGSLARVHERLAANRAARDVWSGRLGIDLNPRENVGIVILAAALAADPRCVVIFSTSSVDRLRRTVRRLQENSFSEGALAEFRRAFAGAGDAN